MAYGAAWARPEYTQVHPLHVQRRAAAARTTSRGVVGIAPATACGCVAQSVRALVS